jgi:putative hydrolase of the HAD superfamily
MQQSKEYRHIFFDLDHTLWDFDKNARISLEELHREFELDTTSGIDFSSFYEKYLHHNEILWKRYHNGFITSEELKWKRMWRTLLEYGIADEPMSRKMSERFLEILPTKKEVFPYTFEILDYLTGKNYSLHIITNGFEKTQFSKLQHSGLNKYFEHVITSEMSNSVKPQKEIFEFAVARAKTSMQESIMIGDNLEADIAGAIGAGMDSVFVNYNGETTEMNPTFTVTKLEELKGIL